MNDTPASAGSGPKASTAWAIATSVVALAIAFLIYTWMTQDDSDGESATRATSRPTASSSTAETDSAVAGGSDESSADATQTEPVTADDAAQDEAEQSAAGQLTPEQEAFLLDLQRREEGDVMALGEVDAPVVLIEYADYRCPYCAKWATEVKPELQGYLDDGTLRLEYRDIAILGDASVNASTAARAAGEQGRYWEYHDALVAKTAAGDDPDLASEKLLELAEQAGVPDLDQFEQDLASSELRGAVAQETDTARELGIASTPTFIINTSPVQGAQPVAVFEEIIKSEAAKASDS